MGRNCAGSFLYALPFCTVEEGKTSLPELSQQKELSVSIRVHGSSPNQEPTEFTSINENLRNQELLCTAVETTIYPGTKHFGG